MKKNSNKAAQTVAANEEATNVNAQATEQIAEPTQNGADAQDQPVEDQEGAAPAETPAAEVVKTISITECGVGDVVRYPSSKKPYIIAEQTDKGRLMFSESQTYFSKKKDFEVVLIRKADGKLPEEIEETFASLLDNARKELSQRTKVAKAKAEKEAASQQAAPAPAEGEQGDTHPPVQEGQQAAYAPIEEEQDQPVEDQYTPKPSKRGKK